jgi:DnaJ-class molecular chaperone
LGKSGKYGDLKIILGIDVPKKLSPEQKKLITSLGETFGREESEKGFFDKLFGLFF